jgi:hypothetical protein
MADELDEARKRELEYLEQQRSKLDRNSKEFEILTNIINKMTRSIKETTDRIQDLSNRIKDEKDAHSLLSKEIQEERRRIIESGKTKKAQEEEYSALRAKVVSGMGDADEAEKKRVEAIFESSAAIVQAQQRQKVFNDTLATTKSYLLPLGAAAGDVAKSLASSIGKDPLQAGADMAAKYAEKAGQGLNAAGNAASTLGQTFTESTNKKAKYFGVGLQVLGAGFSGAGAAAKLASEAINTIAPIIMSFQKSYMQAAQAGAIFGGGMTELRNLAGQAGARIADLTAGIQKGSEAFDRAGLTQAQATKMVAKFGKDIVNGSESTKLFALGFETAQDRIALMGSAMDQARAKGLTLAQAQDNISSITVQYAKDLKVLQGFVGKDAEKQMEKARLEAQGAALRQQLQGDQLTAFEQTYAVLAKLPGEQGQLAQKALMQMIDSGTTNIAEIRNNPAMMKALEAMTADVKAGTLEAGKAAIGNLQSAADEAKETSASMSAADRARLFGIDGIATNVSNFNNALLALKFDQKTGEELQNNVNQLTNNTDQTTKIMGDLSVSTNKAQVALEQMATQSGAIKLFGEAVDLANKATRELVDMINSATSGKTGSIAEAGAKGLMDVITSPNTWMAAATTIGAELASKLGKIPIGGGSTIGGAVTGAIDSAKGFLGSKLGNVVEAGKDVLAGGMGTAGRAAEAVKAGASGLAGATGADLAKGLGGSVLKKIPIVGSAIAGGMEYMESGNLGRSIASAVGSGLGTALGGIAGTAVLPGVGTAAGGIAGGMAGESAATALYDWIFGDKSPAQSAVPAKPTEQGLNTGGPDLNAEQMAQQLASTQATLDQKIADAASKITEKDTASKESMDSINQLNNTMSQIAAMMNEQLEYMKATAANTKQTAMNVA